MEVKFQQRFENRKEINKLFGGDLQKGIVKPANANNLLLITDEDEIYTDYFYPKNTYKFCMYTGIGRIGHQDSVSNNMYDLNIEVLNHIANHKKLLVFEKRDSHYYFAGEYQLLETHQNVQPDDENNLRRVFVFHLEQINDTYRDSL